ncbi:DUF6049 family protein [Nocardioides sp. Soil805]|uniref:DUF6049 family protein n=1 Tax=Nocardioides sp. Soil805 TaxID=1736416 RepID=UPI00070343E9|nr:DUF6049 family protein [Nocardioides sp. Soil805]KRF37595.1 hypothetical protein ASG94_09930 [Nocardioides sp. Soil805]
MPRPSSSLPALPGRGRRIRSRRTASGRSRRRWALALAATLVGAPLVATAPALAGSTVAPARAEADPLIVHLDSLTPAALSDNDRPVRLTGTVTNQSAEAWTGVNLYAFRSTTPILDGISLAASATIDPAEYVGDRIVEPGSFDTVDLLQPGQTAGFEITVPRDQLGIVEPGAYWIGVHAIGDSSVPRDVFADGRARTFIPYVARTDDVIDTAVVVPIREQVRHTAGGRVSGVRRWSTSLADGGRLDALLDAGESSGNTQITWLVDPAVLATVSRLAAGNPRRSLAPDPAQVPEEGGEEGAAEDAGSGEQPQTPDLAGAPLGPPAAPDEPLSGDKEAVAALAQAWLDRFAALVTGHTVLSLPYGDLDVSAAAAHDPDTYPLALSRSNEVMTALGIAHTPTLAPPDGLISPEALRAATPDGTVLLGETSFAGPPDAENSMVRLLGHKVVVTSSGAAAGGPGPTAADDPLALRQRLLSEAALRLYAGSTAPVVLELPDDWFPQDSSDLFDALDVSWLRPVPLSDITSRPASSLSAADLSYTEEDAATELGASSFTAAEGLRRKASVMAGVLSSPNLVRQQATDESLTTLSVRQRDRQGAAVLSARAAAAHLDAQLASIDVVTPSSVTLSSEDGTLGATVVNGLDQPVTVMVGSDSDGSLEVAESDVLNLAPGARSRLLLDVKASRLGVHQVRLVVTDQGGTPLGGSASLPVRAAQVSAIIWYILVFGAVLLFSTIAVRLFRQVRARRGAPDPDDTDPDTDPDGGTDRGAALGEPDRTEPEGAT